ncbi:MAG TPA: ABC transporter permease [Patescibacteria group bacterium]|nr:ABC transporter permease [Patescibacteria group bacterium]
MKIKDIFQESYIALSVNKVRSILTMLGIVIGIGSVIAMVAIGAGAKGSIESSIQSIGSNLLFVLPGMQRSQGAGPNSARGSAQTLTLEDAEAISDELSFAAAVSPELSTHSQVTAKGTNTNTQITGVTNAYAAVRNVNMSSGSFISEQHQLSSAKVAVLGPTTRDDLFGENADVVGEIIRINKMNYTIIGVTQSKGGSSFGNQDDMIFIPLATAQHYLASGDFISNISIQAVSAEDMDILEQEVTELLLQRHNINNPQLADFSVMNQSDLTSTATSVTNIFTTLLASIAGISLLVGGIGIMNMMLTTVTERTREIGLRKAIGAQASDIHRQFLMEAVMLTLVGGACGIGIGWLLAFGMTQFAHIATQVSFSSIALAFGVSAFIGIVFGYYPAHRAAKLKPIEALRFE